MVITIIFVSLIGVGALALIFILNTRQSGAEKAKSLAASGRDQDALKIFLKTLEKSPSDLGAHYEAANIYARMGDAKKAKAHLSLLVGNTKEFKVIAAPELYERLGDLAMQTEDAEEAIKYFTKLLDVDENNQKALKTLGMLIMDAADYALAVPYLSKAFALAPSDAQTLEALAYCLFAESDYQEAAARFGQLTHIPERRSAENLYAYFLALALSDASSVAIEEGRQLTGVAMPYPYHYHFMRLYAYLLFKANKISEASDILSQTKSYVENIGKMDAFMTLVVDEAFYYYFSGELTESRDRFQRAIEYAFEYRELSMIVAHIDKMIRIQAFMEKKKGKAARQDFEESGNVISKSEEEEWETAVEQWENSFIDAHTAIEYAGIKRKSHLDAREFLSAHKTALVLEEAAKKRQGDAPFPQTSTRQMVDRLGGYSLKDFAIVCSSVVKKKLEYTILEEYISPQMGTIIEGDGVDYICYKPSSGEEVNTLISFRRWNTDKIGELAIREFIALMETRAMMKGILFVTGDLTKAAKTLVEHTQALTVYERAALNRFVMGEIT